jgi:hypothetical protein
MSIYIFLKKIYNITINTLSYCNNALPNNNTDTYNQKRKEKKRTSEKKSCYNDLFFVAADQTTPKQHQKSIFFKSDTSKRETIHKCQHLRDHRLYVFTQEKSRAHKTMPSTKLLPGTIN